jgi:hypothetical protein
VGVQELVEYPGRPDRGGVEQRGGGVLVDVGAGVQAEQQVRVLLLGAEALVGPVEGGGDAAVAGRQLVQPVSWVAEPLDKVRQGPGWVGP